MCGVRPIPGCRMWGAPAVSALGLAVMWRCWNAPRGLPLTPRSSVPHTSACTGVRAVPSAHLPLPSRRAPWPGDRAG